MCYPVCGMVQIKDPLLLSRKSSQCSDGREFPLLLSEWSFTINKMCALLNTSFPSLITD